MAKLQISQSSFKMAKWNTTPIPKPPIGVSLPPSTPTPTPTPTPTSPSPFSSDVEMAYLVQSPPNPPNTQSTANIGTASIHQHVLSMSPSSSTSSSTSNDPTFLSSTSKHDLGRSIPLIVSSTSTSVANPITLSNHSPSSSTTPNSNVDLEVSSSFSSPLNASVSSLSAATILGMSFGMTVEFMTVTYVTVGETLVPTLFKSNPTLFHIFLTLNLVSITSIVVLILIWLIKSQKMPRWMEQCLFQFGLIPLVVDCYIFIWVIFPDDLKYVPCTLGSVVFLVALYLYICKGWEIYTKRTKANAKSQ